MSAISKARADERRGEVRIPVDLAAELTLSGSATRFAARVVDISPSGLGLSLDRNLPVGAIASVRLDIGSASGEIRHCTRLDSRYLVGLKLDQPMTPENAGGTNAAT